MPVQRPKSPQVGEQVSIKRQVYLIIDNLDASHRAIFFKKRETKNE
jgi:hypothetical protein